MRWIPLAIVAWVMILAQATLAQVLTIERFSIGTIGPDLLSGLAVFIALYAPRQVDALLAAWGLGLLLDLASAGGPGSAAVVGPMAISYVLAAKVIYSLRDVFFRDRVITRFLLTAGFCLIAHGLWVIGQSLLAWRQCGWADCGRMLIQAAAIAVYSALIGPVLIALFYRGRRWLMYVRTGRSERRS